MILSFSNFMHGIYGLATMKEKSFLGQPSETFLTMSPQAASQPCIALDINH